LSRGTFAAAAALLLAVPPLALGDVVGSVAKKVCRWVEKKIEMGFDALLKDPALAACREGCRLAALTAKTCKACERRCVLGVCATVGDCKVRVPCVPVVMLLDSQKHRKCVETQCKKIVTTKVQVCDR
jgi:hypothetical protein